MYCIRSHSAALAVVTYGFGDAILLVRNLSSRNATSSCPAGEIRHLIAGAACDRIRALSRWVFSSFVSLRLGCSAIHCLSSLSKCFHGLTLLLLLEQFSLLLLSIRPSLADRINLRLGILH